jgi:hypothetical protein
MKGKLVKQCPPASNFTPPFPGQGLFHPLHIIYKSTIKKPAAQSRVAGNEVERNLMKGLISLDFGVDRL